MSDENKTNPPKSYPPKQDPPKSKPPSTPKNAPRTIREGFGNNPDPKSENPRGGGRPPKKS